MKKVYRSKISLFLLVIMIVTILSPIFPLIFKEDLSTSSYIIMVLAFVFCLIIIVPTFTQTYYSFLTDNTLHIKSGFLFNKKIAITSIRKVEETRNIVSSPALSLDRLEIFYNKFDTVLVSPEDKEGFVAMLQSMNPDVQFIRRKKA